MSTYKVIQDIEAEDKILGPLTLRQFIYALISTFFLYLCFVVVTKHAPFLLAIFLPPALFTGFFAAPFGKDQPTEVWAVAKVRFLFKPRRRVWDQSGVKELVTITVPKRVERVYTDGLSQTEVRSRLKALASTIDSRGWAVKNVNVNLYSQPGLLTNGNGSDRLIDVGSLPQSVPDYQVTAADDMLDERSSPIAQQFTQMIDASTQAHRQQLIDELNGVRQAVAVPAPTQAAAAPLIPLPPVPTQQPAPGPGAATEPPNNFWFMNQPDVPAQLPADQTVFSGAQVVQPGSQNDTAVAASAAPTADEAALLNRIKAEHENKPAVSSHMRTIQPLSAQQPAPPAHLEPVLPPQLQSVAPVAPAPVTPPPDAAILNLANNNDLNVATLAREAQKAKDLEGPSDEVVISLR